MNIKCTRLIILLFPICAIADTVEAYNSITNGYIKSQEHRRIKPSHALKAVYKNLIRRNVAVFNLDRKIQIFRSRKSDRLTYSLDMTSNNDKIRISAGGHSSLKYRHTTSLDKKVMVKIEYRF